MERQEINELTLCFQWERDISGCEAGREKSSGESQLSLSGGDQGSSFPGESPGEQRDTQRENSR